jgi:hypothetical protein
VADHKNIRLIWTSGDGGSKQLPQSYVYVVFEVETGVLPIAE